MAYQQTQSTLAARCAHDNFHSNLRALRQVQPDLAAQVEPLGDLVEWVFGRDGALTARTAEDQWYSGCSLPYRAAQEMLRRLELRGVVACFLAPTHAAQVRVALERLRPEQAIVVIVPDSADLRVMLACHNFRGELESHRLWFVSGTDWERQLSELFESQPGLATPAQFVRVAPTEAQLVGRLVTQAQQIFSQVAQNRAVKLQAIRSMPWRPPVSPRLCAVAPSRFRLWNDLGHALTAAARDACAAGKDGMAWTLFDADDPISSSPLGLVQVARQCSAILTANTARCDLPGALPDELPWITWLTAGRIPSFSGAGPRDRLILADPQLISAARAAGWPEACLGVGTWPCVQTGTSAESPSGIALVADTARLDAPEELNEYSSHTVLWNSIREELLRDPSALGTDPQAYLHARMRQLDIGEEGFPRPTFVNCLIVPAYQQGIAKLLIEARVTLRLHGEGWAELPAFAVHACGPVESREQLARLLGEAAALVHAWPTRQAHPADSAGVPALRTFGRAKSEILAEARRIASSANSELTKSNAPAFTGQLLRSILENIVR